MRASRFFYWFIVLQASTAVSVMQADQTVDVSNRRQLFIDGLLIDSMAGVRQVLHHPVKREIAISAEYPWEEFGVSYMTAFRDQDRFRAWYRVDSSDFNTGRRRSMTAYAESTDGIRWQKPMLGLIEFKGSKENNLVWDGTASNLAVFRDDSPNCKPHERYKAVARSADLFALVSPDGLQWKLASDKPIFTERPFDSHNIAFWDHEIEKYVAYTRGVRTDGTLGQGMMSKFKNGVRWVRRSVSDDFRNWTELKPILTGDAPREEFYTNSTIRYQRAPDYLLMFPSRFASGRQPRPDWKYGKGVNDIVLLSSRDGLNFDRTFMEAFIRPGLDQKNWHERSLYMERGILQTSPTELSLYCMQNWRDPTVHIRRYSLRPDGFVSIRAGYAQGEMVTRPLVFSGKHLHLNYSTSAVGHLTVGIEDDSGNPIAGFANTDCSLILGDQIDAPVRWKSGADLSHLAGKPVRLRFAMSDADLFAFRFTDE